MRLPYEMTPPDESTLALANEIVALLIANAQSYKQADSALEVVQMKLVECSRPVSIQEVSKENQTWGI